MSKNLRKVQDMLDGNYKSKIQVGYNTTDERREVGDKWIDSDGNHWEQRDGYRTKNTSNVAHHSWDKKCSDCEKLILKKIDKEMYRVDGRCYHCQMNYELDLKFEKPIRLFAYRRLKELQYMDSLHNDMEQWVFSMHEHRKNEKIFDMSVANAMANDNVEMSIKKNKA